MASIKEMLKAEIKTSIGFSKQNFGLEMGEAWPEMVKELLRSATVSGLLQLGVIKTVMSVPEMAEKFSCGVNNADEMEKVMLETLEAFKTPLQMFYWGIQVGRKQEHEEAEALRKIEGSDEKTELDSAHVIDLGPAPDVIRAQDLRDQMEKDYKAGKS